MERTISEVIFSFNEFERYYDKIFEEIFFLILFLLIIFIKFIWLLTRVSTLSERKILLFCSFFKIMIILFVFISMILRSLDLIDGFRMLEFQSEQAIYKMYYYLISLGALFHELIYLLIIYIILRYVLNMRLYFYEKRKNANRAVA